MSDDRRVRPVNPLHSSVTTAPLAGRRKRRPSGSSDQQPPKQKFKVEFTDLVTQKLAALGYTADRKQLLGHEVAFRFSGVPIVETKQVEDRTWVTKCYTTIDKKTNLEIRYSYWANELSVRSACTLTVEDVKPLKENNFKDKAKDIATYASLMKTTWDIISSLGKSLLPDVFSRIRVIHGDEAEDLIVFYSGHGSLSTNIDSSVYTVGVRDYRRINKSILFNKFLSQHRVALMQWQFVKYSNSCDESEELGIYSIIESMHAGINRADSCDRNQRLKNAFYRIADRRTAMKKHTILPKDNSLPIKRHAGLRSQRDGELFNDCDVIGSGDKDRSLGSAITCSVLSVLSIDTKKLAEILFVPVEVVDRWVDDSLTVPNDVISLLFSLADDQETVVNEISLTRSIWIAERKEIQ